MSAHTATSPVSDGLALVPSDITSTPIQAAPFVNYIEKLNTARDRMASLPEPLCPSSRTPSPVPEPRSDILRTRLKDAMKYANFNPMSSKWNKVSGLLRTKATSRRYWTAGEGVRIGEKVEVEVGRYKFMLPSTDEEWKQCEEKWGKRFEKSPTPQGRTSKFWPSTNEEPRPPSKAELVRDKVKAWQANVVPAAPAAPATSEGSSEVDPAPSSKGKGKEVETKRQSPLPFPVAKRNAAASLTDKPAQATEVSDKGSMERSTPRRSPDRAREKPRSPRRIADISEMYIPPSFPQQLVTSTPGILGKGVTVPQKVKPPPILPRQYASSPSSSPRLPNQSLERIVPPLASSSSLPPVTPSPHRAPKRVRPITPPSEASPHTVQSKKARTLPESDAFSNAPPPPTTPPVPTSPPQTPPRAVSSDKGLGNAKGLPVPSTPDNRGALPTLTELLASSRRSRPRPRPPSRKQKSAATTPAPDGGREAQGGPAPADELPAVDEEREASPAPTHASRARTLLSSPASGSSGSPQSVRDRPRSPVSPLFAKPGDAFAPPFASTQAAASGGFGGIAASQPPAPGTLTRGSSGAFGMGYNSQFDVEGQVGMVSDLLEKDVDFDGWLRDMPEVEAET